MAKNTFLDWSTTASNNTDIGGTGILGTNAVSNFDDAFRTLMAQLRSGVDGKVAYAVKVANYTALLNDNNAVHRYTATATVSLTLAATLGAGWHYTVIADGADVTIDPNGAETIDGAATLVIPNGQSEVIICNGTSFYTEKLSSLILKLQPFATIASAATTDLSTVGSQNVTVTGTTTITALGTAPSGTFRRLRFSGILTLTHNATSLILPGAANITTAAGDIAEFISEGSGNWRCVDYTRASGAALTQQFTATYDSGDQTITAAGLLTLTHGLGKKPFGVQLKLKCTTAERGYSIGDEIEIAAGFTDSAATSRGASVYTQSSDATTTLYVRYGSNANTFNLLDKGTGAISNINNANWRLIVKAWA